MAPAGITSPLIRRHAFPCGRSSHGLTGFTGANPSHVRITCFWGQLHVLTTVTFHSGCAAIYLPVLTPPIWRSVERQRQCPVWVICPFFYQFCNSICIWKKMEILSHDDDWILRIHICTKRMKFLRYMQKAFKDSITLPWVTIDRSRNITKYLWANAIVIFVFKRWRMRNESVKFIQPLRMLMLTLSLLLP